MQNDDGSSFSHSGAKTVQIGLIDAGSSQARLGADSGVDSAESSRKGCVGLLFGVDSA